MMVMVYVLVGIVSICGMLCAVELLVRAWERMDRRTRTARPAAYTAAGPARAKVTPIPVSVGALPDRESIGKICSLADHFADHFREVVNS